MCGINGIVVQEPSPNKINRVLDQMNTLLSHRGPDNSRQRVYRVGGRTVGMGFVRLSILDLETGMQPIESQADNSVIMCNGQIYNYIELKRQVADAPFVSRGDMEVALHLYRRRGLDFLALLNGMYAGVILDPAKNRLILFRDRFGIKPLYYMSARDRFLFSSEIKPLFSGSHTRPEMNPDRVAAYFTYRYVPGSHTLFRNIFRVPPGAYLEYDLDSGGFKIKRYWDYRLDRLNPDITEHEALERFYELFFDAVKIRLRSDVEVGSLISGGIDSSAVSALAAARQPAIRLFSIGFDEAKYNELPGVNQFLAQNPEKFHAARLITRQCGKKDLHRLPALAAALEEPISLGTLLPTDMVCEMAAKQVKTVLTGEGADEIFGGYRKFMIEQAAFRFESLSQKQQQQLMLAFPELKHYLVCRSHNAGERYIQNEMLFDRETIFRLTGSRPEAAVYEADAVPWLDNVGEPVNQAIAYETRFRLPDYVILRLDRLSMRHSLEARTPFLDYRLAEFAAGLPVQFKVNLDSIREKYICSNAYVKFNILDSQTAYRRKQPFTIPMADWLSAPETLPDFLQDILLGNAVRRQGILDPDYVRTLSGQVSSRDIGPETLVSTADQVFAVIMFTLWYEAFFTNTLADAFLK